MNTTPTAVCLFLFACSAGAPAFAQETPAAEAPKLAVSSQGKDRALVDIVVALRHAAPADAKCANTACETADHWRVEIEVVGRTPAGKPVTLALTQQKELEKELRSAGARKAKKVGEATVSDASVSIRVEPGTPYSLVQQLLTRAAMASLHEIEFAVLSAGVTAAERRLPVPLPVDRGAKLVEDDAQAKLEEIRIVVTMHEAGRIGRVFGKNHISDDVHLQALLQEAAADFARRGRPDQPVVIDAASGVPWQAIVGVVDVIHRAGIKDVQFAVPAAKK